MLAHEPAYRQWQEAIALVRDHLTLSALTLRVYFADIIPFDHPSNASFRDTMTKKQAMEIYVSYMRLLYPLQDLKGLRKLFVHVAWPWEWTERGRWRTREQRDAVEREVEDAEGRFERMVVGDWYESIRVGKDELGISQWKHDESW